MADRESTRGELMRQLAAVRSRLSVYGIRDASDYAEVLIAEALGGARVPSRVNRGYDVVADGHGRVEVKCRQLPADGRVEERVAIGEAKEDGFESLAVVIFHADFAVKGAVVVPYAAVWAFVAERRYRRLSYTTASRLAGAVDVTARVRMAAER